MKKILHIAEPFATGVLSFLADLTRLQAEEYEVYILWGERPLTPSGVEDLFDRRIHLIKARSFCGALRTVVNPRAYAEVRRWYKQIRPDIVHLHSSASGFVGRWALPCRRTKVFYTPHGYAFLHGNGSVLKRGFYWLAEKVSAWRWATTVACSKGEYEVARKIGKHSTFINNGIHTALLDPYVSGPREMTPPLRVCTSGRILKQKNPRLFNDIALRLPEVRFTWIGEGELKSELTAPNVKVSGWISREQALNVVRSADFFILPSLWEGLPISLLEAMYMKKVCIVSDVIGNRDVIRSGENGVICHGVEEYARAIEELSVDAARAQRMAEAAHDDVCRLYSLESMAEAYNKVYQS